MQHRLVERKAHEITADLCLSRKLRWSDETELNMFYEVSQEELARRLCPSKAGQGNAPAATRATPPKNCCPSSGHRHRT